MCIVKDRERCGGQILAVSTIHRNKENNTNVTCMWRETQRHTTQRTTITHHHVIGFRDIDFKIKLSTLVVTLIWNKKTYHNISIKK